MSFADRQIVVDGKANEALRRLLAARLNVPLAAVTILSGARGRTKRVAVKGVTAEKVRELGSSILTCLTP